MGQINISQFFAKHVSLTPLYVSEPDQRRLSDVERIAQTLAAQGGAPAEQWPFFVEPAKSLIRFSRRWYET